MAYANANTKYGYTREGSSVFSTMREKSFEGIEPQAGNNGLTGVRSSVSPNIKWISKIAAVTIVSVAVIIGITVAIVLAQEDDDNWSPDPSLTETQSTSPASSITTRSTTSGASPTSTTTSDKSSTTDEAPDQPAGVTWLPWNAWLSCSVSCGTGIHRRYRSCNDTSGICEGNYIETAICTESTCPVYGKWTTWSSWGSCDVTCGGGMQIRTRSCNKTDNADLDCVGNGNQEKTCSNWNCPDCTQSCSVGMLNTECDTCICENNVVTGRVVSKKTGSFLSNAFVFSATSPTTKLTESNITGFFTLNTSCSSSQILIVRDGFVDTIVTIGENNIEVQMTQIVMPYLTETPKSKYRLYGETVTMCCNASATPNIDYFEWFKDSLLIEDGVSNDGRFISLNALTTSDSGSYQCRANSPSGAVMSTVANLEVKESPDDFCENALQQKTITLPDDCVQSNNSTLYEVGECLASSCRLNRSSTADSCADETYSCCVMSGADMKTVQCSNYEIQVVVIKACSCATCISPSLGISGTVVDFESKAPVRYAEVWVNGEYETFTSSSGSFSFDIQTSLDQVTILIDDTFSQQYIAGVKVISLAPDMTGTLNIEIKLFKLADPVEIDSTVENTLVAGTSDNGSSIVQIEIPSNAFYYADGTSYTGMVSARLTFLDSTNSTLLRSLPGVFQFTDNEGIQGDLDSYGLFNLHFADSAGHALELGAVIGVNVPSDVGADTDQDEIRLWFLSTETGKWEYVVPDSSSRRRKRRQDNGFYIGSIKYESYSAKVTWYNIDKIRRSDLCYVKVLLFDDASLSVPRMEPSDYVNVNIIHFRNNFMRTFDNYIDSQFNCAFASCDDDDAYILATYYGLFSRIDLFVAEPLVDISVVPYSIIEDVLKIKTIKSNEGPFFPSYLQCILSSTNSSYLRFHYGQTVKEWEVQRIFTPVLPTTMPIFQQINISQFTWYAERTEGYRVCFLKVRLELSDNMGVNKFTLRATSYGDSVGVIADRILGWRVMSIQSSVSKTVCIEYKCSGSIDPDFESQGNDIDYTKVKLQLDHHDQMECTVSEAPGLVSAHPSNVAQTGTTGGTYVFNAPTGGGSDLGVYYATSDLKSLKNAKSNALDTCESGLTISGDPDPLAGVAITFTCETQLCLNWWDCFYL